MNRAYRAIYEIKTIDKKEYLQFIEVKEVNKHDDSSRHKPNNLDHFLGHVT